VEEMLAEQAASYSILGGGGSPAGRIGNAGGVDRATPGKWISGAAGGALAIGAGPGPGHGGASCVVDEAGAGAASPGSSGPAAAPSGRAAAAGGIPRFDLSALEGLEGLGADDGWDERQLLGREGSGEGHDDEDADGDDYGWGA
ncbi:hypothetical protein MNEG_13317, partial [Monoraphidium neglectum]